MTHGNWGDGIVAVSTPGHGGLWVSPALLPQIPAAHRAFAARWAHGFGEQWYEEDCAAAAVVAAFPDRFPADMVEDARRIVATCIDKGGA